MRTRRMIVSSMVKARGVEMARLQRAQAVFIEENAGGRVTMSEIFGTVSICPRKFKKERFALAPCIHTARMKRYTAAQPVSVENFEPTRLQMP